MRILVVDDDLVARQHMNELLSSYGFCDNAPNGLIALFLFEEACKSATPYDLITMDVEMDSMSGIEAVGKIRDIEKQLKVKPKKAVKIIMATIKKNINAVSNSYFKGCDAYVVKPVNEEDMKDALKKTGFKV